MHVPTRQKTEFRGSIWAQVSERDKKNDETECFLNTGGLPSWSVTRTLAFSKSKTTVSFDDLKALLRNNDFSVNF